jgi:hypothetical protein
MKPTDFEARFSVYDSINRARHLRPHEEEALLKLVRKQQLAEKDARYYQRNREACLARSAEYLKKNPDKNREACRRWREKQKLKPKRQ